jgi:hypothetical protein
VAATSATQGTRCTHTTRNQKKSLEGGAEEEEAYMK